MAINSIPIHKPEDFVSMRKSGKLAAMVLSHIEPYVDVGISTLQLNDICHEFIISHGAIPAPLNYHGFPKSICTSVNNVVCHGIPSSDVVLADGDIINIDVTVILDGWYGDTSKMFCVGDSFKKNKPYLIKTKKLVDITFDSMMRGIDVVKPGSRLSEVGLEIQTFVEKHGLSVVRDYCGHGIGRKFHQEPTVLHYMPSIGEVSTDIVLKTGMFFTIEPMVNIGKSSVFLSKKDNWTVSTRDGSLSAQFEHTVGVTETGCEIFTTL